MRLQRRQIDKSTTSRQGRSRRGGFPPRTPGATRHLARACPTSKAMTRWALLLEYDGTPFVGWQRQINGLSIQEVVEQAAAHLNAGRPVASIVAGRTDAGVHAEGQVAHIDLPEGRGAKAVRDALNYYMKPHPVVVLKAAAVPDDWNARFSADCRAYRYRILNRRSRPAVLAGRVW